MSEGKHRKLVSPSVVRELLRSNEIHPQKGMGQNFLIDGNILRIIASAAALSPKDVVIEVGPGLGALTQLLVERCDSIVAIESDPALSAILEVELAYADNLRLVRADALRVDFNDLFEKGIPPDSKLVSNLPYGIAATLVIDCLRSYPDITEYTVMVQREVAGRLLASAGNRDYSAATVKVRHRAVVSKVATVSRNCFYPPPGVDSAIIRIERKKASARDEGVDSSFLDALVSAAFGQRRKKLVNALTGSPSEPMSREDIEGAMAMLELDDDCRAEDLSVSQYEKLAVLLTQKGHDLRTTQPR